MSRPRAPATTITRRGTPADAQRESHSSRRGWIGGQCRRARTGRPLRIAGQREPSSTPSASVKRSHRASPGPQSSTRTLHRSLGVSSARAGPRSKRSACTCPAALPPIHPRSDECDSRARRRRAAPGDGAAGARDGSTRSSWPRQSSPASTRSIASAGRKRWRRSPMAPRRSRRSPRSSARATPMWRRRNASCSNGRHRHDRRPSEVLILADGRPIRTGSRRSPRPGRARRRRPGGPRHRRRGACGRRRGRGRAPACHACAGAVAASACGGLRAVILVRDLDARCRWWTRWRLEHLEIATADAERLAARIRNAVRYSSGRTRR